MRISCSRQFVIPVHGQKSVSQAVRKRAIVCCQDNHSVLSFQGVYTVGDPALSLFVQSAQGLVHDQDLRLHGQDCGEGAALFFASAQVEGGAVPHCGQGEHFQIVISSGVYFFFGEAQLPQAEGDFVLDAAGEELSLAVLKEIADAAVKGCRIFFIPEIAFRDGLIVQQVAAGLGEGQSVQNTEEGRFAAAVGSCQDAALACLQMQADMVQTRGTVGIEIGYVI